MCRFFLIFLSFCFLFAAKSKRYKETHFLCSSFRDCAGTVTCFLRVTSPGSSKVFLQPVVLFPTRRKCWQNDAKSSVTESGVAGGKHCEAGNSPTHPAGQKGLGFQGRGHSGVPDKKPLGEKIIT